MTMCIDNTVIEATINNSVSSSIDNPGVPSIPTSLSVTSGGPTSASGGYQPQRSNVSSSSLPVHLRPPVVGPKRAVKEIAKKRASLSSIASSTTYNESVVSSASSSFLNETIPVTTTTTTDTITNPSSSSIDLTIYPGEEQPVKGGGKQSYNFQNALDNGTSGGIILTAKTPAVTSKILSRSVLPTVTTIHTQSLLPFPSLPSLSDQDTVINNDVSHSPDTRSTFSIPTDSPTSVLPSAVAVPIPVPSGPVINFSTVTDEQEASAEAAYAASMAAAAAAAQAIDALPLTDRLHSKNANHRKSGYQELVKILQHSLATNTSLSYDYSSSLTISFLGSSVTDTNALNSELGIQMVALLVSSSSSTVSSPFASLSSSIIKGNGKELISKIIAKGFGASRPTLIDTAIDAVVGIMQIDGMEAGLTDINQGLKTMNKPKIVKACIKVLIRVCPNFGTAKIKSEPYLTTLPTILLSSDKTMVQAGVTLAKALIPVYPRGIDALCTEYGSKQGGFSLELIQTLKQDTVLDKPANGTGSSDHGSGSSLSAAASTASSTPNAASTDIGTETAWDVLDESYNFATAEDITRKIEQLKLDTKLGPTVNCKWNEKTESIASLMKLLDNHPRLAGDSHTYSESLALLRRAIKDSNNNVTARAMDAHIAFAGRLRSSFGHGAKLSLTDILGRLRDKNRGVVTTAGTVLRAYVRWHCLNPEDIINEFLLNDGWKKASPELRTNMMNTLVFIIGSSCTLTNNYLIGTTNAATVSSRITTILNLAELGVNDASPDVKGNSEKLIGAMIQRLTTPKRAGIQHPEIIKLTEKLTNASLDRVMIAAGLKEGISSTLTKTNLFPPIVTNNNNFSSTSTLSNVNQSTTTATASSGNAVVPPVVPTRTIAKSITVGPSKSGKSTIGTSSSTNGTVSSSSSTNSSSSSSSTDALYESLIVEESGTVPSTEEAIDTLNALALPTFNATKFDAAQPWSERRTAMDGLAQDLCALPNGGDYAEAVVALLSGKTNNFKGLNNPAVLIGIALTVEKITKVCTNGSQFTRRAARIILDGLLPYTKEKKGSEEIGSMVTALGKVVGPCFVASRLIAAGSHEKATPGVMTAVNDRLTHLVETYGIGRIAPLPVITHFAGTTGIQNNSCLPAKTAAIKGLMMLHKQIGPPLFTILTSPKYKFSINDMLMKTLQNESDKETNKYDLTIAKTILGSTQPILGEIIPPTIVLYGDQPVTNGTATTIAMNNKTIAATFGVNPLPQGPTFLTEMEPSAPVDILSLLPKSIMNDLDYEIVKPEDEKQPKGGKDNDMKPWQIRMKAVETVTNAMQKAIDTETVLLANDNVISLLRMLRKRLVDTQANTRPKACQAVAMVAKAVGPSIVNAGLKLIVPSLLDLLGEKKNGVKEAALQALDALVTETTSTNPAVLPTVLPYNYCAVLETTLKGTSPVLATAVGGGREEILPWLAKYAPSIPKNSSSVPLFTSLTGHCMEACGDKTPVARAAACDLLAHIVRIAGVDHVRSILKGLKNSVRLSIESAVESAIATGKALANVNETNGSNSNTEENANATEEYETTIPTFTGALPLTNKNGNTTNVGNAKIINAKLGTTLKKTTGAAGTKTGNLNATVKPNGVPGKTLSATTNVSNVSTGTAANKDFNIYPGAAAGRNERTRSKYAETTYLSSFNIRLGDMNGDLPGQHRRLYNLTSQAFLDAKCLSSDLHAFMFAEGDTAPDKNIEAMKWLTATFLALPYDGALAAKMPQSLVLLNFVKHHFDLLLRYIAVQLWEPRNKPAAVSATYFLMDRMLALAEGHGWNINWAEGEIVLPALCEKVIGTLPSLSTTNTATTTNGSSMDKSATILARFIALCGNCSEYSQMPNEAPLTSVMQQHIYSRILDTKAKANVRITLASVAARVTRETFRRHQSINHQNTLPYRQVIRTITIAYLARYCERDGLGKDAKASQNVELRNAIGEILVELFIHCCNSDWNQFWKLCHIDAKTTNLPYGTTLDIETKLRNEFEKKWMPSWLTKREKDIAIEAKAFLDRGLKDVSMDYAIEESTQPLPFNMTSTTKGAVNHGKSSNEPVMISDDEIVAGVFDHASGSSIPSSIHPDPSASSIGNGKSSSSTSLVINDDEITGALLHMHKDNNDLQEPVPPLQQLLRSQITTTVKSQPVEPSLFSPERPLLRSVINQSSVLSASTFTSVATTQPLPLSPSTPVLLPTTGDMSIEPFSAVPRGLTTDCPVNIASALTNLRTACRTIADTLGMTGRSNKHPTDSTYGKTLKLAFIDTFSACEALQNAFQDIGRTAHSSTNSVVAKDAIKGICNNNAAILDTLSIAWLVIPSAPVEAYKRESNDGTSTVNSTTLSPTSRNRLLYQKEAEKAMAALPLATSALLRDIDGIGAVASITSSYGLLSSVEACLHRYWALRHAPTFDLRNRCLMNAVYFLRRDHVAAWLLAAMKSNAQWTAVNNGTTIDTPPLIPGSKRYRALRTLLRRLPSYEYRGLNPRTVTGTESTVSTGLINDSTGNGWLRNNADLTILARHFINFFDDPIVSRRVQALYLSSTGNGGLHTLTTEVLGCEITDDHKQAIVACIDAVRELFIGMIGQVTLAFGPTLTALGVPITAVRSSATRQLYHSILLTMAKMQNCASLATIQPWKWDPDAAQLAHVKLSTMTGTTGDDFGTTTTNFSETMSSFNQTMMTPVGKTAKKAREKRIETLTPHDAFTVERIRSIGNNLVNCTTHSNESSTLSYDRYTEELGIQRAQYLLDAARNFDKEMFRNYHPSRTENTNSFSQMLSVAAMTPVHPHKKTVALTTNEVQDYELFSALHGIPETNDCTNDDNHTTYSSPIGTITSLSFDTMLTVPPTPMPVTKTNSIIPPKFILPTGTGNTNGNTTTTTASSLFTTRDIATPLALKPINAPKLQVPVEITRPLVGGSTVPASVTTVVVPESGVLSSLSSSSSVVNTLTAGNNVSGTGTTNSTDHTPHSSLPSLNTIQPIANKLSGTIAQDLETVLGPLLMPGTSTDVWKTVHVPAIATLAKKYVNTCSDIPEAKTTSTAWKDVFAKDALACTFYIRITTSLSSARAKVLWAYLNRLTAPTRVQTNNGIATATEDNTILTRCGIFALARYITAVCSGSSGNSTSGSTGIKLPQPSILPPSLSASGAITTV